MDTATPYVPPARPVLHTRKLFQDSQRAAARNIVEAFKRGYAYTLLLAPMQSGKTGTFHCVARMMLDQGLVDYVYILSGCAEKVLEYQAIEDAKKYNRNYVTRGAMEVCFHGDMVSMNKKNRMINTARTLWILDESHMVQSRGQHVDRFFKRHGLSAYGTTDDMLANETFVLSVSATPYSELSAIHYNESLSKHVEELVPGEKYYGVEKYWAEGHILDTFDIMANKEHFLNIIRAKGNSYNLIRCTSRTGLSGDETYASFIKKLCTDAGFQVLFCTTDEDEEQIAITHEEMTKQGAKYCMEDEPTQPTVVILKGRLRAGKVVPKEHIGIVWENSKDPNVDTVLQSLLGRMCGYIADQPNKPDIYLPPSFMEETKTIIKASHIVKTFFGKDCVPSKATNMKTRHLPNVEEWLSFPTVPIFINRDVMRARVPNWDTLNPAQKAPHVYDYLKTPEMREHFLTATYYTTAQKGEIQSLLNRQNGKAFFRGVSSMNHSGLLLQDLKKCAVAKECPLRFVSNCTKSSDGFFMVVFPEDKADSDKKWSNVEGGAEDMGHCWVHISLKNKNLLPQISMEARIAKSNDKHIFKIHVDEKTADKIVAVGPTGLKESVCNDPSALKKQMNVYLGWWRRSTMDESAPAVGSSITAFNAPYVGLKKSAYKEGVLNTIKETLEKRWGIEMTIIDTPAGPHNLICVTKIHWVNA